MLYIVEENICHYCLLPFSTEEVLKRHIKDCFNINGKKKIIIPRKCKYVRFKIYERKIKSPFIIYADFESILVPEDTGNQNPKEFYANNMFLADMAIN